MSHKFVKVTGSNIDGSGSKVVLLKLNLKNEKILEKQSLRSKNFLTSEVDLLMDLIKNYKHILENKVSDKVTNKQKDKTWFEIEKQFNGKSKFVYRDSKTLRGKYDNLKKCFKKKLADNGYDDLGECLTDTDLKIREISLGDISADDSTNATETLSQQNTGKDETNLSPITLLVEGEDIDLGCNIHEESSDPEVPEIEAEEISYYSELPLRESEFENNLSERGQKKHGRPSYFVLKNHKKKISSPSPVKSKRTTSFNKSKITQKVEDLGLNDTKKELLQLQKKLYEEQINFQREEHCLKMKCLKEEHDIKMTLLKMRIGKEELDAVKNSEDDDPVENIVEIS